MKTVCNWYHPEIVLKDDGNPDGKVSHGLCIPCLKQFKTENFNKPPLKIAKSTRVSQMILADIKRFSLPDSYSIRTA